MRRVLPVLFVAACGGATPSSEDPGTTGGATEAATSAGSSSGSSSTDANMGSSTAAEDTSSSGAPSMPRYEERGEFGVGLQTRVVEANERVIDVTLWYPSEAASGTTPLANLLVEPERSTLADLMGAAPAGCARAQAEGTVDAPLAPGSFPLVLYSHCYSCLGLSSSFIAERLASHGFIVAGVTHTGGTLFDELEGNPGPLDGAFLQTRAADVRAALDDVLGDDMLSRAVDPDRVGMFGHSFGATTTGLVLQDDDRVSAGVAIAAPIENPLLPGVAVAEVAEPMLYLLMEEDNSILQVGNTLLRNNAMAMPGGSWLVELADAGHWSPSDLCGLTEGFMPCCRDGLRQTDGTRFSYLDAGLGRAISASYVAAFFALQLQGDPDAEAYLGGAHPEDTVTVTRFVP